jgi:hypothetical protein
VTAAHDRAELLGIGLAEYARLAKQDPRIVAVETASAPAWRAWLAAGRPVADLSKLLAYVSDRQRELLTATLATLPAPATWWACTGVLWVFVGDGIAGQMRVMPSDVRHVIVVDAAASELASICVHELAHSVHARADVPRPEQHKTEHEMAAIELAVATIRGDSVQTVVDRMYEVERIANATAARWGWPSSVVCTDAERTAGIRIRLHAARDRAAEIVAELGGKAATNAA